MSTAKIAISIDEMILRKLDQLIKKEVFPNRSQAIQKSVCLQIERIEKKQLAMECKKLDRRFEQKMAEEFFDGELEQWPKY